jgi:hypothetical protein
MYRIPFVHLPGFSKFDNEGFEHLFPENKSAREQYDVFKEIILHGAATHKYVPVMRMCDGEYIYSVGRRKGYHEGILSVVKIMVAKFFRTQTTSWGENYTRSQNRQLKKKFPDLLRFISKHGFIANHFFYTRHHFCEEYIEPMQKWYAKHGIAVDSAKFTSFYFVYVLLNGPDSLSLYKDKNILVITSFPESKRQSTAAELKRRGASGVFFQEISATSSMLDNPDLSRFAGKIDLVLIAAGIGSANILVQCESLNVPCIDSGFCLECLANPAVRQERIYCVPDQEF